MPIPRDSSDLRVGLGKNCLNLPSSDNLVEDLYVFWILGDGYGVGRVYPSIEFEASLLAVSSDDVGTFSIGTNSETPTNVVARTSSCTGDEQTSQSRVTRSGDDYLW